MSDKDAANAVSRLYRFGLGKTFTGQVYISTGNRRPVRFAWERHPTNATVSIRSAWVNPSKGWKHFVHDLSHWLDQIANGRSKHSKHHARFEAKLVREVVKRGWLDPKPEPKIEPKIEPAVVVPINNTAAKRELALGRIEARIVNWERKAKRAKNALAKLAKQQRYYLKALAK